MSIDRPDESFIHEFVDDYLVLRMHFQSPLNPSLHNCRRDLVQDFEKQVVMLEEQVSMSAHISMISRH